MKLGETPIFLVTWYLELLGIAWQLKLPSLHAGVFVEAKKPSVSPVGFSDPVLLDGKHICENP